MITILSFFAKDSKTSEMTTISTDFETYRYTRVENGQVVEQKDTTSINVATVEYQSDLSRAIESKKQIVIL